MCPVCREPLIAFELGGIEIDRCAGCEGTWLDAGELERIVELGGLTARAAPDGGSGREAAGRLSRAIAAAGTGRRGRRRCPRCRRRLGVLAVGGERPIEVDSCPIGQGLWFDRGEMEALVRRFAAAPGAPPAADVPDSTGSPESEEGLVARHFAGLYRNLFESKPKGD